MPQVSYTRLAVLTLLVSSVFFVELGSARLWDRDEPRNSRASHEMLARGDWIVPTFNGSLRDHKPILLYWGQMASYLAWGESEWTARLPSALCALLSVCAVGLLASRLSGKSHGISHEGFWAAGCLATCLLFVMAGRAATPDSCLIAFSTMGIAALAIAALAPSAPYSSGRVAAARWLPAMFGYLMLGLAALAKGPVGIILPLAVVHAWWMICWRMQNRPAEVEKDSSVLSLGGLRSLGWEAWLALNPLQCLRAMLAMRTLPGVLLSLLAAAPWYAAVGLETNGEFLKGFFLEHNVGRAMGSMEGHDGSLLFYPLAFVVGTFPWSLWLIPVLMWCRSASRQSVVHRQLIVLAGVWIAVYVAAFSAAHTKLPSYITPCYAGAALALGCYWRQFENAWSRPSLRFRQVAYLFSIFVGVGISVAIWWLSDSEAMPLLRRAAACGLAVSGVGLLSLTWETMGKVRWVPMTWLSGAAAFQIILFGYGAKSVDGYRQDLSALAAIEAADSTSPQSEPRWLSVGGLEPSWVHYLGREIVEVIDSDPDAWEKVHTFVSSHPHARVVVVGEQAHEQCLRWQRANGIQLRELTTAKRFLRPGDLWIYEPIHSPATRTAVRIDADLE